MKNTWSILAPKNWNCYSRHYVHYNKSKCRRWVPRKNTRQRVHGVSCFQPYQVPTPFKLTIASTSKLIFFIPHMQIFNLWGLVFLVFLFCDWLKNFFRSFQCTFLDIKNEYKLRTWLCLKNNLKKKIHTHTFSFHTNLQIKSEIFLRGQ